MLFVEIGINKYGNTSQSGMGQVPSGKLYIRYRSSSKKKESEECKSLQTTSFCCSCAKSTLTFPLTSISLEKTKHKNLACSSSVFFFFFLFVTQNLKIIHSRVYQEVQQYSLVRNGAGSKCPPVHKVQEQLPGKQSRGVEKAYRLIPLAILMLNVL